MKSKRRVKKGDLLIAEPFLGDMNFSRSVIYMVEHNRQGSIGFVLNKLHSLSLMDVMETPLDISLDIPVYLGGPVQTSSLFVIHPFGHIVSNSIKIQDNIYWGGDFEKMNMLIINKNATWKDFKFFLGYSGWGFGQLDAELDLKSWIIAEGNEDLVFQEEPDNLWKRVVSQLEPKIRVLANSPIEPYFN